MGSTRGIAYSLPVSYSLPRAHLGAEDSPKPTRVTRPKSDEDVARSYIEETVQPMRRERGWVAVPTFDMRQYVRTQMITIAIGVGVGIGIGAVFGNVLAKYNINAPTPGRLIQNPRRKRKKRRSRRTSTRKRKRGRPTGGVVRDEELVCTLRGQPVPAAIDARGHVNVGGLKVGTIYDLGTVYRAVPFAKYEADPRNFTTLANAVKFLAREAEAA